MPEQVPAALKSVIPPAATEALHVGIDDLPYITRGDGQHIQLLHVDLKQGLVVIRAKLAPGFTLSPHYHAGMVLAVTTQGSWYYSEYPETINRAGSYLFEPAGSVHTLCVPADQKEDTIAWFAIFGANINIGLNGEVTSISDAHTVLRGYRAACEAKGLSTEKLIVMG